MNKQTFISKEDYQRLQSVGCVCIKYNRKELWLHTQTNYNKEICKEQKKNTDEVFKKGMRKKSLEAAVDLKPKNSIGVTTDLTVKDYEPLVEAEKIYKWLIKDLV